jgi:molecular chaperone GrpE (heat shock protein)
MTETTSFGATTDVTTRPDTEQVTTSIGPEPYHADESASTNAPEAPETFERIARELERVARQQAVIEAKVDENLRLGELRERTIDRLHAENQALRLGEHEQALTPVFRDLITVFDTLAGLAARYAKAGETTVARDVATVRDTVADILGRYDVEHFGADPGTPVLTRVHRVLDTIPGSQAQDCTIAEVHRVGFRTPRRVLRYVEVTAYKAPPASQSEAHHNTAAEVV